jgi:release factor glutamine methyltransferase
MVLRSGTKLLIAAIGEGATRDARILMAHTLNVPTDRLTLELSRMVTPTQVAQFEHAIHRRASNTPISHIIGRRAFWNHDFRVTPDVLDPRPETETIIELALKGPKPKTILDLGTGSGCILVSLLAELPEAKGLGTDISDAALAIAAENATTIGVKNRAQFQNSDWFETVTGQFDLIVSNPPYITAAEMDDLSPDVRDYEPYLALTPGGNGLAAYHRIAQDLPVYLAPNGNAFFEIGKDQGADVHEIFDATGIGQVSIHQDLNGHERIIAVKA